MGCIVYESNKRKRVAHKSVPIMFGSFVDYLIRDEKSFYESRVLFGSICLLGNMKIFSNLSSFNALSLHVRQKKTEKYVEWYLYVDGDGLALKFSNGEVQYTYRKEVLFDDRWVELINKTNPFISKRLFTKFDYIALFTSMLNGDYDINDLKNRQTLSGPVIMQKFIEHDFSRRRKNQTSATSMARTFEYGNIFSCISKNGVFDQDGYRIGKDQSYITTLHEGRSGKTCHFLSNMIKTSNEGTKNATNYYPSNAYMFLCPLNTKDLKTAGDQYTMADYVIMNEETDRTKLHEYLHKYSAEFVGNDQIIIDAFLTDFYATYDLSMLLTLKNAFPHITTSHSEKFIHISTKSSIMVKFSSKYNHCFSAAECEYFQIQWPEMAPLSITAKVLDSKGVCKTTPAKSTVSINHIRGSVAIATSDFHKDMMKSSLGLTCYMEINKTKQDDIYNSCVISTNNNTDMFYKSANKLKNALGIDVEQLQTTPECIDDVDKKAAWKHMTKLYDLSKLLLVYDSAKIKGTPYTIRSLDANILLSYMRLLFMDAEFMKLPEVWICKLNACFGNINGSVVLDGVVIDKKTANLIPPIRYNVTITVNFKFKNNKGPNNAKFIKINNDLQNENMDKETLIGVLITDQEILARKSKHCTIRIVKIGSHLYHLIHFLPKSNNLYKNLKVSHIRNREQITIMITGYHDALIKEGVKFAISHGQKNICSSLVDFSASNQEYTSSDGVQKFQNLSNYWGITRDGRKVHTQVMYSDQSIFSRLTAGQIHCMLSSKDLAFGPNGEIIAPLYFIIHSINPYMNIKLFDVKVDTLTNTNGFDSQNLNTFSHILRGGEKSFHKAIQLISMHSFDLKVDNSLLNKSLCIKRNLKKTDDDECSPKKISKFW